MGSLGLWYDHKYKNYCSLKSSEGGRPVFTSPSHSQLQKVRGGAFLTPFLSLRSSTVDDLKSFLFHILTATLLLLLLRSSPFLQWSLFRNPSLLGDSLPEFYFSTRPGRLETVPSRSISYVGFTQILVFSLVTRSDHSWIFGVFLTSGLYTWNSVETSDSWNPSPYHSPKRVTGKRRIASEHSSILFS